MEHQYKFITFDGNAGAGKTTSTKFVNRHLGIPILARRHNDWTLTHMQRFLFDLMERHVTFKDTKDIVTDEYYYPLWRAWKMEKSAKETMLNLMLDILNARGGRLPTHSFYLDITLEESKYRYFERTMKDVVIDMPVREHSIDLSEAMKQEDENARVFWNWMSERIETVHIIDAMRPEQEVQTEILQIIEEERQ